MKNFEYDFTLPPFPAFPSASRYVALGPVMETVARVARSVLAREAISLVIGPPGTGKSLACALLAREFDESHDVVAIGETSVTDEISFYRFLLHRMGVAFEPGKHDDLELIIHERLTGQDAGVNGALLIIDEAAALSADVLEAIRRLTNIMRDGQPMVSAVVAGGVKLDDTLTAPSLEPFVQRVTARCYLHPLNASETRQYIRQSIQVCDASPDETITDSAISAIFHATSGVTRLINQLMTEAIDCAAEAGESLIDEHTVGRAWASLQQLPGPMIDEPTMEREDSVVEFGELVDLPSMNIELDAAAEFDSELDDPSFSPVDDETEALAEIETEIEAEIEAEALVEIEAEIETEIKAEALVEIEAENVSEYQLEIETSATGEGATGQVACPVRLFGEFEDEEKIDVGAAQDNPLLNKPVELDLESMLHSEIVSLSHFASENTASRFSSSELISIAGSASDEMIQEEAEAVALEGEDEYPSVVWYDEPSELPAQSDETDDPTKDDTDLLWITEDIDVERPVVNPAATIKPHRVDGPGVRDAPKLSVDYREMLEKMRNQV